MNLCMGPMKRELGRRAYSSIVDDSWLCTGPPHPPPPTPPAARLPPSPSEAACAKTSGPSGNTPPCPAAWA
eukprot:2906146-Pyramimonas_sp.AAC.1